jgi:hypothetical protein
MILIISQDRDIEEYKHFTKGNDYVAITKEDNKPFPRNVIELCRRVNEIKGTIDVVVGDSYLQYLVSHCIPATALHICLPTTRFVDELWGFTNDWIKGFFQQRKVATGGNEVGLLVYAALERTYFQYAIKLTCLDSMHLYGNEEVRKAYGGIGMDVSTSLPNVTYRKGMSTKVFENYLPIMSDTLLANDNVGKQLRKANRESEFSVGR